MNDAVTRVLTGMAGLVPVMGLFVGLVLLVVAIDAAAGALGWVYRRMRARSQKGNR